MQFLSLLIDAKNGNMDAQYHVGQIYLEGIGRRPNLKKAIYWLERSAKLGNTEAQIRLGEIYWCGTGRVTENAARAFSLFQEAAHSGSVKAQYMLGAILATDRKYYNPSQAAYWYQQAALNGDIDALFNLGVMYQNGEGIEQDTEHGTTLIREAERGIIGVRSQYCLLKKLHK